MVEQKSRPRQERINDAVDKLFDATNDMSVDYRQISEAFLKIHPYILNQIAKGICQAVKIRQHDGRVQIQILKNILDGR